MAIGSDPIEGSKAGSLRMNGADHVRANAPSDPDPAELVHEARKAIKRVRALARLLRSELGEKEFKRVNDSLRDAGRRLAGARDAEVRLETLDGLIERHPKALALEGVERLRERLERERTQMGEPADRKQVLEDIATMRRQLAQWNIVDHDFQALAPGLRRIYREGRRRYAHVKHEHADDAQALHDWRKRVKSLYYALDMLGGKKAPGARRATRQADRLGDMLGEDHDLWMLSAYLQEHADALVGESSARETLLKRIGRRRERLRKRSLKLGARLYGRKPGAFARRIGRALSD
jgi:CHAD domain-containing protein